jgi:hypothetical protein
VIYIYVYTPIGKMGIKRFVKIFGTDVIDISATPCLTPVSILNPSQATVSTNTIMKKAVSSSFYTCFWQLE